MSLWNKGRLSLCASSQQIALFLSVCLWDILNKINEIRRKVLEDFTYKMTTGLDVCWLLFWLVFCVFTCCLWAHIARLGALSRLKWWIDTQTLPAPNVYFKILNFFSKKKLFIICVSSNFSTYADVMNKYMERHCLPTIGLTEIGP